MQINPEVSKFLRSIALIAAATAVLLGTSAWLLLYSGELLPVDRVVDMRVKSPAAVSMYGCLYSSHKMYYQWKVALRTAPEVLALGTSRGQEIRSEFFRPGTRFFNASCPSSSLFSYRFFLDSIPRGREPKVLIIALDQFFFNSDWEYAAAGSDLKELFSSELNYREILKLGVAGVNRDIIRNGFPRDFFALRRAGRIGLSALLEHNGLRADGSLSIDVSRIKQSRHNDALRYIASGRGAFAYGREIYAPAVLRLEALLAECRSRGIYVAAFFPPYAHCVYEKMTGMGEKYAYLAKLRAAMPAVFRKYSFGFMDFSDLKDLGASDLETIDGYHGSEKAYLRIFTRMAAGDPRLRPYADVPALKKALASAAGDQTVFPEP